MTTEQWISLLGIAVAVLSALVAAAVRWVNGMSIYVSRLEEQVEHCSSAVATLQNQVAITSQTLATCMTQVGDITRRLDRMEEKLDRLLAR